MKGALFLGKDFCFVYLMPTLVYLIEIINRAYQEYERVEIWLLEKVFRTKYMKYKK